jgi:hypothetical protein
MKTQDRIRPLSKGILTSVDHIDCRESTTDNRTILMRQTKGATRETKPSWYATWCTSKLSGKPNVYYIKALLVAGSKVNAFLSQFSVY